MIGKDLVLESILGGTVLGHGVALNAWKVADEETSVDSHFEYQFAVADALRQGWVGSRILSVSVSEY